jgi:hypothetical protein
MDKDVSVYVIKVRCNGNNGKCIVTINKGAYLYMNKLSIKIVAIRGLSPGVRCWHHIRP